MTKKFCIVAILLSATVLHETFTTAFHVEPILSPITEYLYSFDKGIGRFLNDICECSEVKSCTCSTQLGAIILSARISLKKVSGSAKRASHVLVSKILIGNYKLFEEKTKVEKLPEMCSVFEDKQSYVVNKHYCIKFNVKEDSNMTRVCANLMLKERGKIIQDEKILCLQSE